MSFVKRRKLRALLKRRRVAFDERLCWIDATVLPQKWSVKDAADDTSGPTVIQHVAQGHCRDEAGLLACGIDDLIGNTHPETGTPQRNRGVHRPPDIEFEASL